MPRGFELGEKEEVRLIKKAKKLVSNFFEIEHDLSSSSISEGRENSSSESDESDSSEEENKNKWL